MITIDNKLLNFIRPSDHSTFSPSATDRWLSCPFSVNFCKNIPNETSKYAAEGTLAHSVVEAQFAKEFFNMEFSNEINMQLVSLEDGGAEMLDSAETYVNCIKAWLNLEDEIGKVLHYGLEKGIPIYPENGCFGTADCLIIGTKGCAIIDFKYGKGKGVKPDSLQLRTYLVGVMKHLKDVPEDYKFHAIIVQPRLDIVPRHHEYKLDEIQEHSTKIREAIKISNQEGLYPVEGPQCFWCPASRTKDANLKCPVIKGKALEAANMDFGKFLADMNAPIEKFDSENKKRDEAIIKIMSILPLLQKIAKDGEEDFMLRISQGKSVPGIMLKEKAGNRRWIHEDFKDMKSELKKVFPDLDPIRTRVDLKTITEIEKTVGKGKLNTLTFQPMVKKLVVIDERQQEILGSLATYALAQEE